MPSEFSQRVIDVLSSSIGEFMATKLVKSACEMSSIDIEKLDVKDKNTFSVNLEKACVSFGPSIAEAIRKNVETL